MPKHKHHKHGHRSSSSSSSSSSDSSDDEYKHLPKHERKKMKKWKKDYKKGKIPAGSVAPWKTPGYSAQGNYPHHGGAVHHNVTNPYPQQQGGHYPPPAGYAPPSGYPAGSVPGGYPPGNVPGGYPPPQQQYNPGGFTAPGQCPPPSNAPGYPPNGFEEEEESSYEEEISAESSENDTAPAEEEAPEEDGSSSEEEEEPEEEEPEPEEEEPEPEEEEEEPEPEEEEPEPEEEEEEEEPEEEEEEPEEEEQVELELEEEAPELEAEAPEQEEEAQEEEEDSSSSSSSSSSSEDGSEKEEGASEHEEEGHIVNVEIKFKKKHKKKNKKHKKPHKEYVEADYGDVEEGYEDDGEKPYEEPHHDKKPKKPHKEPKGYYEEQPYVPVEKMGQVMLVAERFQPTVRPFPDFSAEADVTVLRECMKGTGTDEDRIIHLVSHRSNSQRQEIEKFFKTMIGKDLIEDLKSELGGELREVVMALFKSPAYYDAWSLHKALEGMGTKDAVLIEILCTRTNDEINLIKESYLKNYGKNLEDDIKSDTSGYFERLLVSCCQANRNELSQEQIECLLANGPESIIDRDLAIQDAKKLYAAGEKKFGTDESAFIQVLALRNVFQLDAMQYEYEQIAGKDLLKSIDSEMSGDIARGLKAIALYARSSFTYFAKILHKAMSGAGTSDSTLIRVIVSRSEYDLGDIKREYENLHGKSLSEAIKSDTSGDYRKLLLALVDQ